MIGRKPLTFLIMMMSCVTLFVTTSGVFEEFLEGLNSTTTEDEICQMETFEGKCPKGHVLLIQSALLGRIKLGKCVSSTFGHLGCYTDVLPELEMYCSGKNTCSVKVDDQSFKRGMPCHKELKNNLWIKYVCIPVVTPTTGCGSIKITTYGFLSSHLAHKAKDGCGGLEKPWRLETDEGLQINLTLIDFAYSVSRMVSMEARKKNTTEVIHSSSYPESCRVYAIIREPQSSPTDDPMELSRVATICGWSERVSNIFLSTKNKIEIRLSRSYHVTSSDGFQPITGSQSSGQQKQKRHILQRRHHRGNEPITHENRRIAKRSYLVNRGDRHNLLPEQPQKRPPSSSSSSSSINGSSLQQQDHHHNQLFQYTTQPQAEFLFYFRVVGCANPVLGEGMWMRRNRNLLVIGCHDSKYHDTWTLTCVGSTWQGSYGDCAVTGILNISDNVNISSTAIFILGIAILVSIAILIGGIICIKRIHPTSTHCQVRCLRDHYGEVPTSAGYGTASTTPSCNKLHVTGSCPSEYGGSGNDYARMRLQHRFNNYPGGDYSSMASLMTYEPTRAPTFQTNLASGSIQPLHYGLGDVGGGYPTEGNGVHSPQSHHHHHAIIDGNRIRQIEGRVKFGMSCGNLGQQKGGGGGFIMPEGADHQKSISEPYPLFEVQTSPQVMEHIYESPDTLLLKRREMSRDNMTDFCGNNNNIMNVSEVVASNNSSAKNVSFNVVMATNKLEDKNDTNDSL